MKVLSLASVNITINNSNRDDVISFGGGGKLLGSVGYSFAEEIFTQVRSADGGYAYGHNASKAGTVTITINQVSAVVDVLDEYILWCRDNPELAAAGITIKDSSGVLHMEAKDCLPNTFPEKIMGATPGERTYTFLCGEVLPKEYMTGGNV